jgi:hypothetical protein
LDFSKITIDELLVSNTGNDCLDLSAGRYLVNQVTLSNCGDKGVSIGEMANVEFDSLNIDTAVLGLAVKDWSTFASESAIISNTQTCISVYRKKQEFGRAVINIGQLDCSGSPIETQDYSKLSVGK